MVKIRLARHGAKKRPVYKIVATNSRSPRDGRNIESLGYFNPIASGKGEDIRLHINKERVQYWISTGAQLSSRVSDLLKEFEKTPREEAAAAA